MASVQFRNCEAVITAYIDRDVPAWAMFQGKQFLFSYAGNSISEGSVYLEKILSMISESAAIYTLCIYEDLPDGKIKSNTAHDGSFNFRLNEYEGGGNSRMIAGAGDYELRRQVEMLTQKMDLLLNEDEEEETEQEENNLIGQINQVMAIPGIKEMVMGFSSMLFKPAAAPSAGAIAGPHELNEAMGALTEMGEVSPVIIQKIIRLNEIRKENPKLYETYISYLQMIN